MDMIPRVIVYDAVSLDGRTIGLDVDKELYNEIASKWDLDAVLMGSNTVLAELNAKPGEVRGESKKPQIDPEDERPLLVVPDSRGQIRVWDEVREMPYFRDILVLCSRSTPQEYLDFLEKRYVKHMVIGYQEVDLGAALNELNVQFGVKSLRVDSGGVLNGVLFREGLVDEVNVLIHPELVGGKSSSSIFPASELNPSGGSKVQLVLVHVENLKTNFVWLQYRVFK
jgi:2,5-diamino-6-(ribosylamino)-4(3H)-pyrimidinone 5'-phosphate reductase